MYFVVRGLFNGTQQRSVVRRSTVEPRDARNGSEGEATVRSFPEADEGAEP